MAWNAPDPQRDLRNRRTGLTLFLYYRYRTIGTVMSENLGLPFGILGVALEQIFNVVMA